MYIFTKKYTLKYIHYSLTMSMLLESVGTILEMTNPQNPLEFGGSGGDANAFSLRDSYLFQQCLI